MMDIQTVFEPPKRRDMQCGKYELVILDEKGPVIIYLMDNDQYRGLWIATGSDAEALIRYTGERTREEVGEYIDTHLSKWYEAVREIQDEMII